MLSRIRTIIPNNTLVIRRFSTNSQGAKYLNQAFSDEALSQRCKIGFVVGSIGSFMVMNHEIEAPAYRVRSVGEQMIGNAVASLVFGCITAGVFSVPRFSGIMAAIAVPTYLYKSYAINNNKS